MPHIFFQKLEKRHNTQTLSPFNTFGFDVVAYPEYGIGLPYDPWTNSYNSWSNWSSPWSNWGWSSPGYNWNPFEPVLIYAAPVPSSGWSSVSPWAGSDSAYPPGTLYGLIKRSNLKA